MRGRRWCWRGRSKMGERADEGECNMLHGMAFRSRLDYTSESRTGKMNIQSSHCQTVYSSACKPLSLDQGILHFRWHRAHVSVACLPTTPNTKPESNPSIPCHVSSGALPFKSSTKTNKPLKKHQIILILLFFFVLLSRKAEQSKQC